MMDLIGVCVLSASEPRWNNTQSFKHFYWKAKALTVLCMLNLLASGEPSTRSNTIARIPQILVRIALVATLYPYG